MNNNNTLYLVNRLHTINILMRFIQKQINTENLFAQIAYLRSGASYEHRIKIMTDNDKPNSPKRKAVSQPKQ